MKKDEAMSILKSENFCKEKWSLYKEITAKMVEKHDPCELLLSAVDYLSEYNQWVVRLSAEEEKTLYKPFDALEMAKYHVMATVYIMVVDHIAEKYEDVIRMIEKTTLTNLAEKYIE